MKPFPPWQNRERRFFLAARGHRGATPALCAWGRRSFFASPSSLPLGPRLNNETLIAFYTSPPSIPPFPFPGGGQTERPPPLEAPLWMGVPTHHAAPADPGFPFRRPPSGEIPWLKPPGTTASALPELVRLPSPTRPYLKTRGCQFRSLCPVNIETPPSSAWRAPGFPLAASRPPSSDRPPPPCDARRFRPAKPVRRPALSAPNGADPEQTGSPPAKRP